MIKMGDNQTIQESLLTSDRLIVSGNIKEAASILSEIKTGKLSRKQRVKLASLQRRVGSPERATKLLLPIVRAKKVLTEPVTDEEKAEYAICLQRQGSINEALKILNEVDTKIAPEALLYRAVVSLSDWDFEGAKEPLRELLSRHPEESYLTRTARLNLSAATIMGAPSASEEPLLKELIDELAARGENLLLSNALEVLAQQYVLSNQFAQAQECLDRAEKVLLGIKVIDRLWIMKWRAVLKAKQFKDVKYLDPVLAEAVRRDHRETFRDLDFHRLQIKFDRSLFLKLYFGTRSAPYRQRLRKGFPNESIPSAVAFLGKDGVSEDLSGAKDVLSAFEGELAPGALPHSMLILLFSDWYIKFRSGHVHSSLFPTDFFNPETSMNRIHQIAKRLRDNLAEQRVGVELDPEAGAYRLMFESAKIRFLVENEFPEGHPDVIRIHLLRRDFPNGGFISSDVEKKFGVSRSAANRLLQQWREAGRVRAEGQMTAPRYFFA